jgi:uncharacterized protein
MNEPFQILSLDGGGIKGLFSAAVLAHLEEDLGVNLINHFDLIVGTSTGGIIALALAIGKSPKEIAEFYVTKGKKIFPPNAFGGIKVFCRSKYDSGPLEAAIKEYLGDKKLADSQKRLVIPAYNIGRDDIYLFKTPHHDRLKRDYKEFMWKVAMATAAAPVYLPIFKGIDNLRLVDGGVWANNPTMIGVIEAISMLNVSPSNIKVLSLGTTMEVRKHPSRLDRGGYLQWCQEAIKVLMQGQSIGAYTQAAHLLGKDNILRLNPMVPDSLFKLDKLNFDELSAEAADFSRKYTDKVNIMFLGHKAPEFQPIHK